MCVESLSYVKSDSAAGTDATDYLCCTSIIVDTPDNPPKLIESKEYELLPMDNEKDEESALIRACGMIAEQYERWPKESVYYAQGPGDIYVLQPAGVTEVEFQLALRLWDIHSLLCANLLFVCWRTEQLSRAVQRAMTDWDLIVGASAARALLETAAAFTIEAGSVSSSWEQWKNRETNLTPEGANEFRKLITPRVFQFIVGTRIPNYLEGLSNQSTLTRTGILSLIDKAAKQKGPRNLRKLYDALCDAVHPNFGSNEVFFTEMGISEEIENQMRVLFSRDARGRSELPSHIRRGATWALDRLTSDLAEQKRCCDDICLTLKLWCVGVDYFGIVHPD